jgi:hypothetical protein
MINWSKPIETMDGRRVNWVADLVEVGTLIYVYPVSPDNCGDAFIVNHEGFRVDDRAPFSARQEPFIRNVKVKKEGWVLMRPSSASMDGRYLADDRVYASEADAKSANANWYGADLGVKPVRITLEE